MHPPKKCTWQKYWQGYSLKCIWSNEYLPFWPKIVVLVVSRQFLQYKVRFRRLSNFDGKITEIKSHCFRHLTFRNINSFSELRHSEMWSTWLSTKDCLTLLTHNSMIPHTLLTLFSYYIFTSDRTLRSHFLYVRTYVHLDVTLIKSLE